MGQIQLPRSDTTGSKAYRDPNSRGDPIRLPRELQRDGLSNELEKSSSKSTDYIPLAESENFIDYFEKGC